RLAVVLKGGAAARAVLDDDSNTGNRVRTGERIQWKQTEQHEERRQEAADSHGGILGGWFTTAARGRESPPRLAPEGCAADRKPTTPLRVSARVTYGDGSLCPNPELSPVRPARWIGRFPGSKPGWFLTSEDFQDGRSRSTHVLEASEGTAARGACIGQARREAGSA